ncbi:MAG: tRNA uridine-5-carboxymethylaminomethyl(34) synthesis GTPase MnmE [Saprospiraceae bacterium]|nr:tRNA uridine-5-carboxymethylaminomethyl(34) synthesis GTPase MnmE [Saprospiraceae bacterium]MCF8251477.1 tRNA uridine-5-carboxymethylaminomethyl(34) synthesis GTPase MnmE [Saprospiraceae bacterium]MCF8280727.1 tRNA uridine-5-carboxymethylaminomethyl(34) synthesis GTPase MnmE [Bacteroidales bacterium]MCF8313337.1 tRNA uridine-5-carboxymethylaminomethyl(34) synthesis GTPase MnmE [Saprospiraceae bacterium]MCF8441843.1 tRNA uridine-5-carboxymethylaminomethyl(34) synthesis GTPase MnmE [Saprospira
MNYSKHDLSDTIVALATPPGVGAIGVIRLSGERALAIAEQVFSGKKLTKQPSHTLHFGTIKNDDGQVLDEVLVSVFKGPNSYTGENITEVSCHGSPFILQKIIELFIEKGARMAQPGEFTLRAFLNGKMDLSQAEAVADLIASTSESSHGVAMRQMRGGFSHEIQRLRDELVNFASLIELELDFAEEDVEFANRPQLKALVEKIHSYIHALIQSFKLGNVLKTGVPTVIAGRPNAGKSTLLNALLNEERAIVSEIAGTTRDTVEEVLNIRGVEFRLIDTAGIREAQDQIEAIGVEKTMEKIGLAALLVYVFDVVETKIDEVLADVESLRSENAQLIIVCNKMDKLPSYKPEWLLNPNDPEINDFFFAKQRPLNTSYLIPHTSLITLSAKSNMNVPYLKEKLFEAVIGQKVSGESTIVTNARHLEALQKAATSLDDVLHGLDTGITSDFVAMDIRRALNYLGEITGEVGVEDLLGNIFSKFCIGK